MKIQIFYDPFTMGRFVLWSILSLASFLLLYPKFKQIRIDRVDWIIGSFYLINLVSVSWAKNFGESIFMAQTYFLFFYTYFTIKQILFNEPSQRKYIFKLILWISIVSAVYLCYEIFTIYNQIGHNENYLYAIAGLSGHKNLVSSHLFLLVGFLLYFTVKNKKRLWPVLTAITLIFLIFALRSRAVYLATFALIVTLGLFVVFQKFRWDKRIVFRLAIVAVLLTGSVALFLWKTEIGSGYIKYLNPAKYAQSASGTERMFVWYKTTELIKERPILGYGCGNWKLWFPSNDIHGGFRLQEQGIVFIRAHNDFLEIWSEVGIVGLGIYLSIFIVSMYSCLYQISSLDSTAKLERILLVGILLGYMIIAFFSFPKERTEHQILLATIFALIANLRVVSDQWSFNLSHLKRIFKNLIYVLTFSLLLFSFPMGYFRSKGEVICKQLLFATASKKSKLIPDLATNAVSIWQNVNLSIIPYVWYKGIAHYWEKDYLLAESAFSKAYEINPYNFNVLNNYGSALVKLEKYEEAIPIYKKALTINPKFEMALFNISYAYYQIGNKDSALKHLENIEINLERKNLFIESIKSDGHIKN